MKSRLPPGVQWLLALGVPIDQRESICGDLEEDFLYRSRISGRVRAAVHTWSEAFRISLQFARERAMHGRGLPPIGDEVAARESLVESIRHDLRFGGRMMARQPAFAVTAILALAFGTGGAVAVFTLVDAALWRPLPFASHQSLVAIGEQRPREQRAFGAVSAADFLDWRRDARTFSAMAASFDQSMNLTGGSDPMRIKALRVSPGFLSVLGVTPARGRDFRQEEEVAGNEHVVLLTDDFWRRRFDASPGIVGQAVRLDGTSYEVAGVLPATFWWKTHPEVVVPLVPLMLTPDERSARSLHFMEVVAKLRTNATFEQAQAELELIGRRLEKEAAPLNDGHFPRLVTLREALVGNSRPALVLLLSAVSMVLLMACTNVAMLVLARAAARQKELTLRTALGAGRGRLVRQLLTESTMLGLAGGTIGILAAVWMVSTLRALLPAQYSALPGMDFAAIDGRVVMVALALSFLTSLTFGSVSAFTVPAVRLSLALNEEGRTVGPSSRGSRVRSALVVAEVALSVMLLVGAGLLLVSFNRVLDVATGFQPEGVVTAQLALPASKYPDRIRMAGFHERLLERLRALPGIETVGTTTAMPFNAGGSRASFQIEGRSDPNAGPNRAQIRLVTSGYVETLRIPLVRGRVIDDRDRSGRPPVALINNEAARRYWPDEDPVGRHISFSFIGGGEEPVWLEIVGIVGDVKHTSLEAAFEPEVYVPYLQANLFPTIGAFTMLAIRSDTDVSLLASQLQSAVRFVDADQPVESIRSMDALIANSVAPRRLNVWLLVVFAAVAVVLAAVGLYGVMACLVVERTREIGVRMALGATGSRVVALVMWRAGLLTVVGVLTGIGGAWVLSRYLSTLLFGVSATDPLVYLAVALLLAAVTLLATAIPSIRATRIDPILAIRT